MKVPFNDLARQYRSLEIQMNEAVLRTIQEFKFIRSSRVTDFENAFAHRIGANACIATGNGTDSLFLMLKALNIQPGDEVITPAFSWISSAEVISLCGAQVVFADVDCLWYTIDPAEIERKITPRTKAVIVVHLYGQAAPMQEIVNLCERHRLFLIEDCAQAHLTRDGGHYAGTFGNAAAFSFYPTKNLGAYGDAGCVVTNDHALAEKVRRLANHGALQKDDHLIEGANSRMDSLQAAVLSVKMPYLERWNTLRNEHAQKYCSLLKEIDAITPPAVRENSTHTFHLFVIRTKRRDELQHFLNEKSIETLIHYPCALPNTPAYRYLKNTPERFPVATTLQEEVLSLPMYPELSGEQIQYVCENIREFFRK